MTRPHTSTGAPSTPTGRLELAGHLFHLRLASPFPDLPAGAARGTGGKAGKLTRLLERNNQTAPQETGSRRQANARPQPHQGNNDVTGGTAAIFTPGTAPRSGIGG